jgi:mono/diheme cytochrome c family protein
LLTRTVGQWYGYSYLWNDAQDDATLVSAQGLDKDYEISAPSGRQSQRWHYPSRTECMVCHSRAANYVLGLSEPQFNRVHDYNGIKANQLDVLEELGVLRVNWTDDARGKMKASLKRNGANEDDANKAADAAIKSSGRTEPQISPLLTSAPESRTKLVDPYDPSAPLNDRARSYLHANCSVCHVKEGGGNALMEMEFSNSMAKTHLLERPQHDKFGMADPWLVSPGHPEQSVLLHRISTRGQGQMPPLATSVPDAQAIELIRKWISQLKAE